MVNQNVQALVLGWRRDALGRCTEAVSLWQRTSEFVGPHRCRGMANNFRVLDKGRTRQRPMPARPAEVAKRKANAAKRAPRKRPPEGPAAVVKGPGKRLSPTQRTQLVRRIASSTSWRGGRPTRVATAADVADMLRQEGVFVSVRTATQELGPRVAVVRRARKAATMREQRAEMRAAQKAEGLR